MFNAKEYNREYRLRNKDKLRKKRLEWEIKNHEKILNDHKTKYAGIYGSWYAMKQRCNNPNNIGYKNYGGRGITYDKRWESFENFKQDMEETYEKGLLIDRIDNSLGYSKENCRWTTSKVQNNNRRYCVVLTHNGMTMNLTQWADYLGIKSGTLLRRYQRRNSVDKILCKENLFVKRAFDKLLGTKQ